jgi:hypothetical protein
MLSTECTIQYKCGHHLEVYTGWFRFLNLLALFRLLSIGCGIAFSFARHLETR